MIKRNFEKGFTLVEALLALVIFSVGLLGILGLQGVTMTANDDSRGLMASRGMALSRLDSLERLPIRTDPQLAACNSTCLPSNNCWCHFDVGAVSGNLPLMMLTPTPGGAPVSTAAYLDENGRISPQPAGRFRRYWHVQDIPPPAGSTRVTRVVRMRVDWTDLNLDHVNRRAHFITYNSVLVGP